jgi:hypothetical protein
MDDARHEVESLPSGSSRAPMRAGSSIRENTVSKSPADWEDWSIGSESLFRAARADHDATASDREHVAAALARRLEGVATTVVFLQSARQVRLRSECS